jgi:DNA-binding LacI/PurR family transcriptional regulator
MTGDSRDIYGILVRRIREGVYPSGSRLATERVLAEEFGVHRNTVRRAIARLVKDGLVERQVGCRPIVRATLAASSSPRTVALLMGSEDPYRPFNLIMGGCEKELRRVGYRLVFMDTWARTARGRRLRESEALQSLLDSPVQGVIIWCQAPPTSLPLIRELVERSVPVVAIDRRITGLETDFVGVDNLAAAAEIVEYLHGLGHRNMLFVTGTEEHGSAARERETAFTQTLKRLGLPHGREHIIRFPMGDACPRLASILAEAMPSTGRPTAVFALSDFYAWRVVHALEEIGLSVPDDVSVVGFDDTEGQQYGRPRMTTMRQPWEKIGRHGARRIIERMQNPALPIQTILLDTTLLERTTTKRLEPEAGPVPSGIASVSS